MLSSSQSHMESINFSAGPNVHDKIAKCRWAPLASLRSNKLLFAIASESDTPSLSLWSYTLDRNDFDTIPNAPSFAPLTRVSVASPVSEFQFIGDGSLLAAALQNGSISIYGISPNGSELTLDHKTSFQPHASSSSNSSTCTSLSAFKSIQTSDVQIASVGNDGSIAFSTIDGQLLQRIDNADSVPMTSIRWKGSHEVLVSSTSGRTSVFDVRQKIIGVSFTNFENRPTMCAAVHPYHSHQLATGTDTGDIYLWDIRNPSVPQSEHIQAHSSIVWELAFKHDSHHIYSCSEDGKLGLIHTQREAFSSTQDLPPDALWMGASQFSSKKLSVLSINSFDIHPEKGVILAGGDNARIFYHSP